MSLIPHHSRTSGRISSFGHRTGHRRLQAYADAKRRMQHEHSGAFGRHHPVRAAMDRLGRLLEHDHRH
jgi:hypothetical protein